jgi:hypothetical protein
MIEVLALLSALSMPVEFERVYVNRAWGYQNQRCLVDNRGHVWFQSTTQRPERARRITEAEYARGVELALNTREEKIFNVMVAADMGDLTWSFRIGNEITTIKQRGNYRGGPETAESNELSGLIDKWCEGQPNLPQIISNRP